jgi:hypothetical protein
MTPLGCDRGALGGFHRCGKAFLPFYAACKARIEADSRSAPLVAFHTVCQAAASGKGGGH